VSLPPPPKVQKLQETLHAKAKGAPTYRFYALYDKVYPGSTHEENPRFYAIPIIRISRVEE
jgi:hypothetical protein